MIVQDDHPEPWISNTFSKAPNTNKSHKIDISIAPHDKAALLEHRETDLTPIILHIPDETSRYISFWAEIQEKKVNISKSDHTWILRTEPRKK